MKKILILLATICLYGCGNTGITKEEQHNLYNLNEKVYYRDSDDLLLTVEIEGHLYLIFKGFEKGGITHAEHCPCKNK